MTDRRFHLAWFLNQGFGPGTWWSRYAGSIPSGWLDGTYYIDFARRLEAAGFDYLLIEDSAYVSSYYGGTTEKYLRSGYSAPKLESSALAGLLAQHTDRLGLVATLSTTEWNPYLLARHVLSMDHVSHGRIGWNLVTGGSPLSAALFGVDDAVPHSERYERADEFATLVKQHWTTWSEGAVVSDVESRTLVDPDAVGRVDFDGTYFRSHGTINVPRSPQGLPVITQAGASGPGQRVGGRHADSIIAGAHGGVEGFRSYRDAVRAHAIEAGRSPDDVKVQFIITPFLGETAEEARADYERAQAERAADPTTYIAMLSTMLATDLSTFDLDTPLGDAAETMQSEFIRSLVDRVFRGKGHKTLRELAVDDVSDNAFVGTVSDVADQMQHIIAEVGGDGFLFVLNQMQFFDGRRISLVLDGLIPELQRRGAVRTDYEFETFRENLTAY